MNHSQDQISRILDKLRQAKQSDPDCEVFGADAHRYVVHPPASEEEVVRFEQQHVIALPDAYRTFLLKVGNGGVGSHGSSAGPFYGIYPLGAGIDDLPMDAPQTALTKPCVLSPYMPKEEWQSLTSSLRSKTELDGEAQDAAVGTLFGGLLVIGTQGCTYVHALVLNGPLAGRVVNLDLDYSQPPIFAHEPDFLAWYERWLDEVISGDLLQSPSWFGYVRGGSESELLARLQACTDPDEQVEYLAGLLSKRRLSQPTLEALAKMYAERENLRATICKTVCKSDPASARPLLSDLSQRDPLTFFQCLHGYARDEIAHWQQAIQSCAAGIEDAQTFRFFTYVLEPLPVDRGVLLAPYARSPNSDIRCQALYAMGELEDKRRFLDAFVEGLNDVDTNVVRTALQALDGVNDSSLLPHYRRLVERFPEEQDYVLANLDRRLADVGHSRDSIRRLA